MLAVLLPAVLSAPHRRLPFVSDVLHQQLHTMRMESPSSSPTSAGASSPLVDVVIFLRDQVDVDRIVSMVGNDGDMRARTLVNTAMELAQRTQTPLVDILLKSGVRAEDMQQLWISNALAVRGMPLHLLEQLTTTSASDGIRISRIESDRPFRMVDLSLPFERMLDESMRALKGIPFTAADSAVAAVEWNLPWVQATDMWQRGHRGRGISVAVADTGIQYDHPALVDHYRGNLGGGRFEHDYHWWDGVKRAITPQPGPCGINATVPCDDNGHGTHCTGTIVGATSDGSRQIGVAPEARFIGCRNMHNGDGRPSTYISCLQFFAAPTDLAGRNADITKRPHVISNSYGCPRSEQCEPDSLLEASKLVRAAGIFMAVAAGNAGPSCSSVDAPPGTYAEVYSVAALGHKTNNLAYFSSRGPVKLDGSGRAKPDIAAPGQGIVSAYPRNSYSSLSGTSMATPHVAGVVALLWGAVPSLQRNVDLTERILSQSALHIANRECGSPQDVPNYLYGWGAVRALEAYNYAKNDSINSATRIIHN